MPGIEFFRIYGKVSENETNMREVKEWRTHDDKAGHPRAVWYFIFWACFIFSKQNNWNMFS